MTISKHSSGFSLIELLITIAIIGILTTIAIPSYQKYTRKAHYTEIVQAISPFKLGIEECFQTTGDIKNCEPGKNGVPKNLKNDDKTKLISKISVDNNGSITVTPRELHGIKPKDNYIATPIEKNNQLTWKTHGGGIDAGYAN